MTLPDADPMDPSEREVERLLAAMPLCRPSSALDRRIAASRPLPRRCPRRSSQHAAAQVPQRFPRRSALVATLVACLTLAAIAWGSSRPSSGAGAAVSDAGTGAVARAPAMAPTQPNDRELRWAHARDEGIVIVAGQPMRLWRTRTLLRREHVDPATRTRVTCVVPCDGVKLVSQETM